MFTSHERAIAQAAWSSNSTRLNRESFLPFASCSLCLELARDPVACSQGDIFCRECALSNIIAQKQDIKRQDKLRVQADEDQAREKQIRDTEARERAILEFEMTQQGLDTRKAASATSSLPSARSSTGACSSKSGEKIPPNASRARKRHFELDPEEVDRIAGEYRVKARKALEAEEALKPAPPCFWVPTITPTSNGKVVLHNIERRVKRHPVCPASCEDNPHNYSFHDLITIKFTDVEDSTSPKKHWMCPACRKALSNSSKPVMAKPCGHVLCRSCVTTFMKPGGHADATSPDKRPIMIRCHVCDEMVTEKNGKEEKKRKIGAGLVDLRSEGTGFSAGGRNQVKKSGVGFQC